MKRLGKLIFVYAFIFNTSGVQRFIGLNYSLVLAQLIAYLNLFLLLFAALQFIKEKGDSSITVNSWLVYNFIYYVLGLLASIRYNYFEYIPMTVVQLVYLFSFLIFFKKKSNRDGFLNTMILAFFLYNVLTIFLFHIGYDAGSNTFLPFGVNRAEGMIGDANNSALISIIGYIFLYTHYYPKIKILRYSALILTIYSLFITFSTTGLFIFVVVIAILNNKFFTKERLLFSVILIPLIYICLINITFLVEPLNLKELQMMKVKNIENLLSFNFNQVDSSGRDDLVLQTMGYIYDNPFTGYGIGFGSETRSHNTFINIWADSGILALLTFVGVTLLHFFRAFKLKIYEKPLVFSILMTLLIFMFSLQTVINQPYIIVLYIYLGYFIDEKIRYSNPSIHNQEL